MIRSMTGYGDVQHCDGGVSYALELRTVNNRYFKASIKLPESMAVFESQVEKLLRSRLSRGSVTCSLRLRDTSADAAQEINVAALQSYLDQLGQVGPAAGAAQVHIDLGAVLALPGVCQPQQPAEAEREKQWAILEKLTGEALDHLIEMRTTEGKALREDLLTQCRCVRDNLRSSAERAPVVLQEYHQRLVQRANDLLNDVKLQLELDDVRREVAVYAERCDINEEVARLGAHLDRFEQLCDSRELAGRKLEFLAQEMLREANTIGSKANDSTIAGHILEIKGAIDRLKEQVQNIE